ncbi:hypothetical protein P170DRAFT_438178 [Aspergillus steynii IBT 23096]|uniref:Uncharacterized protein n=1 Tax=Aspergillus steynii IBT 23096 TaxID=1392250 RepID=A0A2I2G0F0_9EURO|nr:uncharacterized protein P170DRAFT_438178 [Aspergillus steynii IBT 23096]PLB46357.1 hypothetical protein P170DRAFT_438178 [Aspergillus steynii IBT 23096]
MPFSFNPHNYSKLQRIDSDDDNFKLESFEERNQDPSAHPPPSREPKRKNTRWMISTVLLSVAILAAISLLSLKFARPRHRTSDSATSSATEPQSTIAPRPCGTSPPEASAAGCIYDLMMNSWLPRTCFDEELTNEFRSLREWRFYADANGTKSLTEEELAWRTEVVYTTTDYHYTRCVYSLRRDQRAGERERDLEVPVAVEGMAPCSDLFLSTTKQLNETSSVIILEGTLTALSMGYPLCARPTKM